MLRLSPRRPLLRWRRVVVSIRLRLALATALVVGVVLLAAGALELRLLDARLDADVDQDLRSALGVATGAVGADGPSALSGDSAAALVRSLGPQGRVQVLGADGELLASAPGGGGAVLPGARLSDLPQGDVTVSGVLDEPRPTAYAFRTARLPDGTPVVVLVASSLRGNRTAVAAARDLLLLAWLPASALAGLGGWVLAGAALRPVRRLRERAEELEVADSARGLPVPATGDEIERLARTLDALVRRLHAANRSRADEYAEIAHELRTPLMALQGELELLSARLGDAGGEATQVEEVEAARSAAARLADLVERQLLLGTSGRGASLLRLKVAEPADLVEAAAARHRRAAAEAGIALTTALSPAQGPERGAADARAEELPALVCDPTRVAQILDNLVNNALGVLPSGGRVRIGVSATARSVVFEVRDDGPGFACADGDGVGQESFERYHRGGEPRRGGDAGMGLGLSIVRDLARAHGGEVELRNAEQGGAVVLVHLPVGGPGPGPADLG